MPNRRISPKQLTRKEHRELDALVDRITDMLNGSGCSMEVEATALIVTMVAFIMSCPKHNRELALVAFVENVGSNYEKALQAEAETERNASADINLTKH